MRDYMKCDDSVEMYFKHLSTLRGERFQYHKIYDLNEEEGDAPETAVAVIWVWRRYASSEHGYASTGNHCFLDSSGYRIEDEFTPVEFAKRIDEWLTDVRINNDNEYIPVPTELLPGEYKDFIMRWHKEIDDCVGGWPGSQKEYKELYPEKHAEFVAENARLLDI